MGTPQSAVLPEAGTHARFVVLRGGDDVARAAAGLPALVAEVGALDDAAALVANVGFGSDVWGRVCPSGCPRGLHSFPPVAAGGRTAPATGGDVLLHVSSMRVDLNAQLVLRFMATLPAGAGVAEDVHGFRYLDSRDLTGFVDGTENPTGDERAGAALIGDDDASFAGGSYVFTQRYVHDLRAWEAVDVAAQEQVIGRTKADSEELPDDRRPATAHISRVVIEEDGEELEILRHSMPYATATEAGLFFVAYTHDLGIPERMLRRMLGAEGDGLHDHLMHYSRAVTGAAFFVPSLEVLASLA